MEPIGKIKLDALLEYITTKRGLAMPGAKVLDFNPLGSGVHGTGYLLRIERGRKLVEYVIKGISGRNFGHDYPSDRAGVFLLALEDYGDLPRQIRAVDVLSVKKDGTVASIGGGTEYYLLMERAQGTPYFDDLAAMGDKQALDALDRARIVALADYLATIHAVKKHDRALYFRKIRDTIGHGECLMGVLDTYPEGVLSFEDMAIIEKKCVDWRMRLKGCHARLSEVHGDFHPGNILFQAQSEFILLDRSRGPWGEPADDVTALSINFVFHSVMRSGGIDGAYKEAFLLFFDEYLHRSGDTRLLDVLGPFFAFRGVVVANPLFYPELDAKGRATIFRFINRVLDEDHFEPHRIARYLR